MHVFNLVSPFEVTLNMKYMYKIHIIVLFYCCLIIIIHSKSIYQSSLVRWPVYKFLPWVMPESYWHMHCVTASTVLSGIARGWGFPPATMSVTPGYFTGNKRKMEPKELPSYLAIHLLITNCICTATWNLSDGALTVCL